jgi:hypothetical protein
MKQKKPHPGYIKQQQRSASLSIRLFMLVSLVLFYQSGSGLLVSLMLFYFHSVPCCFRWYCFVY